MKHSLLPAAALLFLLVLTARVWTLGEALQTTAPQQPVLVAAEPVGAKVCATCHEDNHSAWRSGRHSKMLQPATAESVLGDFTQTSLTLHGKPYQLREQNGEFFITESYLTGTPREHRVRFTLGSRRIQHYLTTIEKGQIVVLPPSWDVLRREWFDNRDIIRPDEDDTLLVQQWNKNCVGCHVSQQENNYDAATQTYRTEWVDYGTTCERCHGPGSAHVAERTAIGSATAARPPSNPPTIIRPTRLDATGSTTVCAQCHSLRDEIAAGFRAGANYYDHFVLKLEYTPRKEQDPVYWADGRPRRFSNDTIGLWQSECFIKGGATCVTCHDPHTPNVDRHPTLAPSNNRLCTQCHQDIGLKLTAHTRHLAASTGSACIECHMPRQVISIKAKIRDHTISLPTPENTVAHDIPNACTDCHADRTPSWAVEVLAKWWPDGARAKYIQRASAFTAARAGRPEALEPLLALAADTRQGPLVQANALGYLRAYPDERASNALIAALAADSPALRMVAAASLRRSGAEGPLLEALDDRLRAVRLSALISLINIGTPPTTAADRQRFARVSAEFIAQARLHEDDAPTQADLGLVQLLNGDMAGAAASLANSRALEPRPRTSFLLGLARLAQKRPNEARALFAEVPPSDPNYEAAQERLKQLAPRR